MVRRRGRSVRTRRVTVMDPWLGKYHSREKHWEVRANSSMYKGIQVGDILVFNNKTCPLGEISLRVHQRLDRKTFLELFKEVPLSEVLPGLEDGKIEDVVNEVFYQRFKLRPKERQYQVVAFRMAPISAPIPTSSSNSTCSTTTRILTTPSSDEGGLEPVLSGDTSRKRKRTGRGQGKKKKKKKGNKKTKNKKRNEKRKEKCQEVFVVNMYVILLILTTNMCVGQRIRGGWFHYMFP